MAKKSLSSVFIENMDFLEKQITLTLPNIVNVTRLANIFLAQSTSPRGPHDKLLHDDGKNFTSIYSQALDETTSVSPQKIPTPVGEALTANDSNNNNDPSSVLGTLVSIYCDGLSLICQCLVVCMFLWFLNRVLWKSKFLNFLPTFLASWLLVLVLAPITTLFLLVCLGGRLLTAIYLRVFHKNQIFLAHPMDATWAFEKYASPSTCTGLYVVKGKCDYDKILRRMEHCMTLEIKGKLMFDRMRYALRNVMGYVCWERMQNFDMKNHVKLISDRNPKLTGALGENEVFEELRRIHDETFSDPNFPPWEILVVPNYIHNNSGTQNKEDSHYALVFRIHHAVMDGVSTGNALHSGIADKPFKFSVDPIDPLRVSKFQQWLAYFLAIWMVPLVTIKNLMLIEKHRFHGPQLTGPKNFAWSKPVRLNTLKVLKTKTKSSVFAILMTCIGGSMRKLFESKNEPVPQVIHAAPPVAILPFPDRMLRNRFSIVIFPIQIGIENLLERLRAVYRTTQELAQSSDVLANFYTMNLLGMFPLPVIKFLGNFAHATMTLSNIPGPAELVELFDGDLLVDVGAWVPVKNTIGQYYEMIDTIVYLPAQKCIHDRTGCQSR